MSQDKPEQYLPLTEATYYIMLALAEPLHGYAVMQKVEEMTRGEVKIGPGTLYGAFAALERQHLITMVRQEERRKSYTLTGLGRAVLYRQLKRLEMMYQSGSPRLKTLASEALKNGGES